MQRFRKIFFIGIVILLGRVSQIIFSVLYSPVKNSYLGIGSGHRTNIITMTGFELQQYMQFTNSKPEALSTGGLDTYNTTCKYGKGNCISFGGQDLAASFNRIDTIQYIGKDIDIAQPSNITNKFNTTNNLKPKRWYPYLFAQYIGPSNKKNSSDTAMAELTRENTIAIGEKGIDYQCNKEKIEKIAELNDQEFLQAIANKNPDYRYPCINDELAHALAFNYYYYLDNPQKAALYYMVASFHDGTPSITLSMPAIIQGREGNNKISAFLRYDRLQADYKELKKKDIPDDKRKKIEFNVTTATTRTVNELSLHILTKAATLASTNKESLSCVHSVSCLKNKNYISQIITTIKENCTNDLISCKILSLGQQSGWIKNNGTLIYPINSSAQYAWKEEEGLRWVKVK